VKTSKTGIVSFLAGCNLVITVTLRPAGWLHFSNYQEMDVGAKRRLKKTTTTLSRSLYNAPTVHYQVIY